MKDEELAKRLGVSVKRLKNMRAEHHARLAGITYFSRHGSVRADVEASERAFIARAKYEAVRRILGGK